MSYIVTEIVLFGYHNRKASKPIISIRVNTFLLVIVGFAGLYFGSKIHIMYIVQKYKKYLIVCRHIPVHGNNRIFILYTIP